MSTRCTITVRDTLGGINAFSLYRHHDGYPDTPHGVIATLSKALPLAWPMPRFAAGDFAAAIVSAWKDTGGDIRLTSGRDSHCDTEYHYEVYPVDGKVRVITYVRHYDDTWFPLRGSVAVKAPSARKPRNMCR